MRDEDIEIASDQIVLARFMRYADGSAFAVLVDRHADRVLATCQRILRHRGLAEEATQEVFFKLAQARARAGVPSSLAAWLHTVATRLAIDVRRRESRRIARERAYEQARERDTRTWADLAPHVDEAMETLDEPDRLLLVEHFIQRRSLRELASAWRTSPATLSRRLRRATATLQQRLSQRGVVFTLAAAVGLLRAHTAEAASPALRSSLGKLSMVAGHTAAVTTISAASGLIAAMIGMLLLVGAAAAWFVADHLADQGAPSPPALHSASHEQE